MDSSLRQRSDQLQRKVKQLLNADLKSICKSEGLPVSGVKATLQARINERKCGHGRSVACYLLVSILADQCRYPQASTTLVRIPALSPDYSILSTSLALRYLDKTIAAQRLQLLPWLNLILAIPQSHIPTAQAHQEHHTPKTKQVSSPLHIHLLPLEMFADEQTVRLNFRPSPFYTIQEPITKPVEFRGKIGSILNI